MRFYGPTRAEWFFVCIAREWDATAGAAIGFALGATFTRDRRRWNVTLSLGPFYLRVGAYYAITSS